MARPRARTNGEGSLFRIDTPTGRRWRAEATLGWDARGKRVVATGTGPTQAMALNRLEANKVKK